jgi:ribosome-associated protein
MRGRDEETGEFHDKSRSQNRRDALDVLALGEKLVSLTPAQLARLPIPEDLLPHIAECKRITAHIAHKRQLAFLAKHMRREEEATLDAIRDALDANSETGRREVAMMHRVEDWRERLLAEVTRRWPHCWTTTRRPTASSCARWCAMRRPRRPRTSRRAPTARSSRCCVP